jgi:hypothetical protein
MRKSGILLVMLAALCTVAFTGCGDKVTNNQQVVADQPLTTAPQNVKAEPSDGMVTVSWDPVGGTAWYTVYWSTSPGVDETSNSISTSRFPYEHTGLSDTTTYYYRVSAVNGMGESPLSSEVSARAKTPYSALSRQIAANNAAASAHFGISVSIDGDYAIVGAAGESTFGASAGAAYIFHRIGPDAWDGGTMIRASDAAAGDYFGQAVSISGDYAIVGAFREGSGGTNAGAAYIFQRTGTNTWDTGTKIVASDAQANSNFGQAVSISGDYAIAGAYSEDTGATNAGAAYIFQRTGANTWDTGTKIKASDAQANDWFGYSVSISGDYAIVGAPQEDGGSTDPNNDTGAAYIFRRTGANAWDAGTKIAASGEPANANFGISVSLNGEYAIVGAYREAIGIMDTGAVYIFQRTGTDTWDTGTRIMAPDAQAQDYFGVSVSISGASVIVGAYAEDGGTGNPLTDAGAAYIY